MYDIGDKINLAVFPGLQGGPHNAAVAGMAVAFGVAQTEEFKHYQRETVKNAQVLAEELMKLGYKIVTGGTDNHIVLCDLSPKKLSGSKAERVLELVGISVNKNTGKLIHIYLYFEEFIMLINYYDEPQYVRLYVFFSSG